MAYLEMDENEMVLRRNDFNIPINNRELFDRYCESDRCLVALDHNVLCYIRELIKNDINNNVWNDADERECMRVNTLVYLDSICDYGNYRTVKFNVVDNE